MPAIVRILIGSYFIATASGLVQDPSSPALLAGLLGPQGAQFAHAVVVFPLAFLMMLGYVVRPMALLLSLYVFYTGFAQFQIRTDPGALAAFWRDTVLLGAVLLIAVTQPGGSRALVRRHVMPRRVRRVLDQFPQRSAVRQLPPAAPKEAKQAEEVIGFECFRSLRAERPVETEAKAA
ncbi:hypothetical protein DYI42_14345 [Vannielia litorea]|nr:hypothetical protein [Vannielia litorea]